MPATTPPTIIAVLALCEVAAAAAVAGIGEELKGVIVAELVLAAGPVPEEDVRDTSARQDVSSPAIVNTGDFSWIPVPNASTVYCPGSTFTDRQVSECDVAGIPEAMVMEILADCETLEVIRKSSESCGPV